MTPRRTPSSLRPTTVGSGTTQSWATAWRRHRDEVARYASRLLAGDVHAAEDVAQETALRLWQHPEVLLDDEPLAGWLRTVARNIVIDRIRRRQARPTEVVLDHGLDTPDQDHLGLVEGACTIRTILAELAPHHRAAILEVYVRDRPVADVAADLGIPVGTVKSRCHNAVRQLRASPSVVAACA